MGSLFLKLFLNLVQTESSKLNLATAISMVAANMIGVGVFTSLGFQVLGLSSVLPVMILWLLGGLVALSGALSYGELAAAYPRSGGEYNFLSKVYHPLLGFLSGWVSMTLGFAAPIAMIAMAFGRYFSNLMDVPPLILALILLTGVTLINLTGVKAGSKVQLFFTLTNLGLIVWIIVCGFTMSDASHFEITASQEDWAMVLSQPFATSLMYVSFAYSGWNSATYISDEIKEGKMNLPKALFYGTSIVMILYLLLNFVFLYSTPIPQLAGQVEVAYVAAKSIFGEKGANIIAGIISIGLVASLNSMLFIGPRVTQVMGQDYSLFKFLSFKSANGSPVYAILMQFGIALLLIYNSTFEKVLTSLVFTLSVFTTLTVLAVLVNRRKHPPTEGLYRTWGYPITPLFFIVVELYMMYQILTDERHQVPSLVGIGLVLIGIPVYWWANGRSFARKENNKPVAEFSE
ncbi:MAG: amino acid permease [Cytophagaceae bacterium]|nr:amino acid permease [Cytophagaceae bacterium]